MNESFQSGLESGNLASVAARIRDRALELEAAQAELEIAIAQLQDVEDKVQSEQETFRQVRRNLLSVTGSRDSMELDIFRIEDGIDNLKRETHKLDEATDEMEGRTKECFDKWSQQLDNLFAGHHVEMELYRRHLQSTVERAEDVANTKKKSLDGLKRKAQQLKRGKKKLAKKQKQFVKTIGDVEAVEKVRLDEVPNLAKRVKEALAKRASLRNALRSAQAECEQANEEMIKWERTCVEQSHA